MSCFYPLDAWSRKRRDGKQLVIFPKQHRYQTGDKKITLPCGQCVGCRLDRSREWALRCVHEAQTHEENCFITLTYDEENLPGMGDLSKSDWQKFVKKLRRRLKKDFNVSTVRYYHAGEYGAELGRPHYHACLFGFDFKSIQDDCSIIKQTEDVQLYKSKLLEEIWGNGLCSVGDVTLESAAYVARYIMKKINGKNEKEHYEKIDRETGEVIDLQPEYTTMSRKPGIGKKWYDKFKKDCFPSDTIVHNRQLFKPPKYYDTLYELENPEKLKEIKEKRISKIKWNDNTPARLADRERVKLAQLSQLKRKL